MSATDDAAAQVAEHLADLRRKRERLERQLDAVREQTRDAVAVGSAAGVSAYRMAQELGLSEAHVGRLRKAVAS